MTTTINNNQRIFLITGDYNSSFICNIQDVEMCCNAIGDKNSIKIQHKWNNRFVRCSKKSVIEMLKSLNLNYSFIK